MKTAIATAIAFKGTKGAKMTTQEPIQTIVFETLIDGRPVQHEARVESAGFPHSQLAKGQLVVEHDSGDYAISVDFRGGEYVARPIIDRIVTQFGVTERVKSLNEQDRSQS